MPGKRALYIYVKNFANPEHPRLWPWIPRTYRATPPQVFVRNPYYWVVDERGNQLPYIDRVQFAVKSTQTLPLAFASGEVSMQTRHVRYENYTELMSRGDVAGFRVLHWYPATRSVWNINPNLNRLVDPRRPDTKWKAQFLADKRFRQALSLAINRKAIIQSEYNNQVEPAQVEPGRESPFHSEKLRRAFTEYDPARANRLLDELGLTNRGLDGMRLFPDGSPMVFYLDYSTFTGMGPAQFVVDDWGEVGVRVIAREQQRELFYARKDAGDFDFNIWSSESDFFPLLEPRVFVPDTIEAFYAPRWSRWFVNGGYWGDPKVQQVKMAEKPPEDHPMWQAYVLYERAQRAPTLEEQKELFAQIADIVAENLWTIGIAEAPPQLVIVSQDLRNVPRNALYGARLNTPGNAGIETYYFENPRNVAAGAMKWELQHLTPRPRIETVAQANPDSRGTTHRAYALLTKSLWYALLIAIIGATLLLAIRFPFVARRLAIMVPTLLVISIAVFTIIQLPPGDFLTSRLIQLQETGDEAAMQQIRELRRLFHFDEPYWKQYARWMGLRWFVTFDSNDTGLLQGNMGRSMGEQLKPVNQIVGDRILLTVLISLGTILFTWTLAIPIGVFSAVKQYSPGDYALTLLGFIGMSVPGFLLALVLMSLAGVGTGLFSPRFSAQTEWDWPKFVDLLKHIWVPIVVLGVGGTASMIRIMRANLLDELRKPYVTTARAKGVRPLKLLFKYPVRMALNPFVSGVGHLFPQLVSGGAIVAIVLALPTVGPLMLNALFNQDMYVAGSMLMVLSVLGVVGTLVSDLLLLWLDPRIRYEGGAR
jgi:ABC-type dipeptide/oligopeptide/nickel transport system permease component